MSVPVDRGSGDTLQPGTILGRYEIRRLLGQGGMGRVYEAQHRDLKKRVAIKTLLPALASNGDARERFLREGEAASRIRHPHVVDVTDVGSEGQVIYLVMEYLEGEDLARLIARQGSLSATQSADILLPVAAAIATAHQQGVIHRDLKPENIFLARTGFGGVHPKVLDFGISKVLGGSGVRALTGTAATMGTMNYLPPESLQGAREADARSDQYGLGTILYECVTGQRAFEEESFYLVLKKIAEGQFVPPCGRRPEIPRRLEKVILRAMSLEPARRFESVGHLGAALLEFASEGVRAFWTPTFGAAASSAPDLLSAPTELPSSSGGRGAEAWESRVGSGQSGSGRVATLAAPTSQAGATLQLPPPDANRPASTTMRNANGERALYPATSSTRRSRAPFVIGGVALVVAVAALVLLSGIGLNSRRPDPSSTGSSASAEPISAEPAAPSPPPPPRPAIAPAPGPAPVPRAAAETPPTEEPAAADRRGAMAGKAPTVDEAAPNLTKAGVPRPGARRKTRAPRRAPSPEGTPATPTPGNGDEVIVD